jgi:putative tricarboxylic transport membrane protein
MFDLLIFSLLGCIAGTITGALPGLSNSVSMVILFPFLSMLPPNNIVAFYICMITATQYFGNAAAILLGIPTEPTCLPSAIEGYRLTRRGCASEALSSSAIASFCGSLLAVVCSIAIFFIGNNYSLLYNFKLQFIIITLTCSIAIFSSNNLRIISFILLLFGYFIGMIGINPITRESFLTFDNPYLSSGIPPIIFLVFLYSLPSLLVFEKKNIKNNIFEPIAYKFILPLASVIRSSIVGFICGFIPMLGIVISSNLSYSIERFINRKTYSNTGDIRGLASSDAGHNSGIVASLIPLFCLAIPITASEYILYDLTTYRGLVYNYAWLSTNYTWIFGIFILANFFGVATSWPLSITLMRIIVRYMDHFKYFGIALLFTAVIYVGINTNQLQFFIALSAVFLPIGLFLCKFDLLPLLLGYMLSQQFDNVTRIVYSLYIRG